CFSTQNTLPCVPTADRPPGYPFFLLLAFELTNDSFAAVRLLQLGILAATAVLLYFVANAFVQRNAAFVGACLTATYPPFVSMAFHHLTESLVTFLAVCFLWIFIEIRKHGKIWQFAALGLVSGYAALVRPSFLLLAVIPTGLPLFFRDVPPAKRIMRT